MKPKARKYALAVDRGSFMAWVQGVLLDRDRSGKCLVGDHVDHEKVGKALDAGEVVLMTVGGKPFSTLKLEEGGYRERPIVA